MTIEINIHGAATVHVHGADGAEVIHINGKPAETSSLDEFVRSVRPPDAAYAHGPILDLELRDGGVHGSQQAIEIMRERITDLVKNGPATLAGVRQVVLDSQSRLFDVGIRECQIWNGNFGEDLLGRVRIEVPADVHLDIELRDGGIHVVSQNAPFTAKAAFDLMRGDITEIIADEIVGAQAARHLLTKHADGLAQIGVCSASIWGGKAGDGDLLGGWNRRPSSRLLEP